MSLHRPVCCTKALLTDFCPHCGKSKEEAEALGETLFPYDFSTQTQGKGTTDSTAKRLLIKTLGITDSVFLFKLEGCDRQVTLNWRLAEDGQLDLRSIFLDGTEYRRI